MESRSLLCPSRKTTGRKKTIRLVRCLLRDSLRNKAPMPGMSPSRGTLDEEMSMRSSMRPPSTRIEPSSTITFVSIERLLVVGPVPLVPSAWPTTAELSWKIVMRIVPPSPICGLMRKVMPTSLRSTVWKGLVVPVPVLVNCPVMKGTLRPTTILASSLSTVIKLGVDMMLLLPLF